MNNQIINKYKDLGIHIEKTKSRQEISLMFHKMIHPYSLPLFFLKFPKKGS